MVLKVLHGLQRKAYLNVTVCVLVHQILEINCKCWSFVVSLTMLYVYKTPAEFHHAHLHGSPPLHLAGDGQTPVTV